MREFALLGVLNTHPVFRSRRYVVPILASHPAGTAPGASGLIKVESYLHYLFSILFSILYRPSLHPAPRGFARGTENAEFFNAILFSAFSAENKIQHALRVLLTFGD